MITIRPMTDADADAVLEIYRTGIDEGNATFETTTPSWDGFVASRIDSLSRVAVDESGTVLGWIFSENEAGLRLHTAAGFRVVGRRERLPDLDRADA